MQMYNGISSENTKQQNKEDTRFKWSDKLSTFTVDEPQLTI